MRSQKTVEMQRNRTVQSVTLELFADVSQLIAPVQQKALALNMTARASARGCKRVAMFINHGFFWQRSLHERCHRFLVWKKPSTRSYSTPRVVCGQTEKALTSQPSVLPIWQARAIDPVLLTAALSFFRLSGLASYEIGYLCRYKWKYICAIAAPPERLLHGYQVVEVLANAEKKTNVLHETVNVADVIVAYPQILFWPIQLLKLCLAEMEAAAVPLQELTSVLVHLRCGRKKASRSFLNETPSDNDDAFSSEAIYELSSHSSSCSSTASTVIDYLCRCFEKFKLDDEDREYLCANISSSYVSPLPEIEIQKFCYLYSRLRQNDSASPPMLLFDNSVNLLRTFNFDNHLYPRLRFLDAYGYALEEVADLPRLLAAPAESFFNIIGLPLVGQLHFTLFCDQVLNNSSALDGAFLSKSNSFPVSEETRSDDETQELDTSSYQRLLCCFVTPNELPDYLASFPSETLPLSLAYFFRWHYVGLLGVSVMSVVRRLPKLLLLSKAQHKEHVSKVLQTLPFSSNTMEARKKREAAAFSIFDDNTLYCHQAFERTQNSLPIVLDCPERRRSCALPDVLGSQLTGLSPSTRSHAKEAWSSCPSASDIANCSRYSCQPPNASHPVPTTLTDSAASDSKIQLGNTALFDDLLLKSSAHHHNTQNSTPLHRGTTLPHLLSEVFPVSISPFSCGFKVRQLADFFCLRPAETQWLEAHLAHHRCISLDTLITIIKDFFSPHLPPQLPIKLLFLHVFSKIPSLLLSSPHNHVAIVRLEGLLRFKVLHFRLLLHSTVHDTDSCSSFPSSPPLQLALSSSMTTETTEDSAICSGHSNTSSNHSSHIQQERWNQLPTKCFIPQCHSWAVYLGQHASTSASVVAQDSSEAPEPNSVVSPPSYAHPSNSLNWWLQLSDAKFAKELACFVQPQTSKEHNAGQDSFFCLPNNKNDVALSLE